MPPSFLEPAQLKSLSVKKLTEYMGQHAAFKSENVPPFTLVARGKQPPSSCAYATAGSMLLNTKQLPRSCAYICFVCSSKLK